MQLNVQTFPKIVQEFAVGLPIYVLPVRRDYKEPILSNAGTSADKKAFKQLSKRFGVIFQCICINRRLLIHIFTVPEYLMLEQWELNFLFILFISTKRA